MLQTAFANFKKEFPPKTIKESDLQLTTDELMKSFEDFGCTPTVEEFIKLMNEGGYEFKPFDDDDRIIFKWIL